MSNEKKMNDSPESYVSKTKEESFVDKLKRLINSASMEGGSNTPDSVLAQYLESCLLAFDTAVQQRENWHGRDPRPSHTRYGVDLSNGEILPSTTPTTGSVSTVEDVKGE